MEPTASPPDRLTPEEGRYLLAVARRAIEASLRHQPVEIDAGRVPAALQQWRAPFVTLERGDTLRGCIGALEPTATLVEEVLRLAPLAARDSRFRPVTLEELPRLTISLSILTTPRDLPFTDEDDLGSKLRPGIDGLILAEGRQRGTLLPQVWAKLPSPRDFIRVTKEKAGWPGNYTAPAITAQVYQVESWSE